MSSIICSFLHLRGEHRHNLLHQRHPVADFGPGEVNDSMAVAVSWEDGLVLVVGTDSGALTERIWVAASRAQ